MEFTKLITPHKGLPEDAFEELMGELAYVYLEKAYDASFAQTASVNTSLNEFLTTSSLTVGAFPAELAVATLHQENDVNAQKSQLVLAAYTLGYRDSFKTKLSSPSVFLFGGEVLVGKACFSSEYTGEGVRIKIDQDTHSFTKIETSHGIRFTKSHNEDPVSTCGLNLYNGTALNQVQFWHEPVLGNVGTAKEIAKTIKETFDLFDEIRPNHSNWYRRVLNGIVPLEWGEGPSRKSSTSSLLMGVSGFSFPISIYHLGEAIAHETSHQYFRIIEKLVKITDPNDTQVFQSPIVDNAERDLRLMFVAYHAVVNMAVFRKELLERRFGDESSNNLEFKKHIMLLKLYEEAFSQSTGITENGKMFWDIQKAALDAADITIK